MKKGTRTSLGAGLATSAIGTATAQEVEDDEWDDEELFIEEDAMKAVLFRRQWHPTELFTIASPIIEFEPNVEGVQDNV